MLNINKNIITIGLMYIMVLLLEFIHFGSNVHMIIALESFLCFGIILIGLINVIESVYGNSIIEIVKKYQKIQKINKDRIKWSIDFIGSLDKIIRDYAVFAKYVLIQYYERSKKAKRALRIQYIINVFFYKRAQINYIFKKKKKAKVKVSLRK